MSTASRKGTAETTGRWLGRLLRRLVLAEKRFTRSLPKKGIPSLVVALVSWAVALIVVTIILYSMLFIGLLLIAALAVATAIRFGDERANQNFDGEIGAPSWDAGKPTDHRQSLYYHPLTYNDDPDPRFSDRR